MIYYVRLHRLFFFLLFFFKKKRKVINKRLPVQRWLSWLYMVVNTRR